MIKKLAHCQSCHQQFEAVDISPRVVRQRKGLPVNLRLCKKCKSPSDDEFYGHFVRGLSERIVQRMKNGWDDEPDEW